MTTNIKSLLDPRMLSSLNRRNGRHLEILDVLQGLNLPPPQVFEAMPMNEQLELLKRIHVGLQPIGGIEGLMNEFNQMQGNQMQGNPLDMMRMRNAVQDLGGNLPQGFAIGQAEISSLLNSRIQTYHFELIIVRGDGNCQFTAVATQISRNVRPSIVRMDVVFYIEHRISEFQEYMTSPPEVYLQEMKQDGTFGDNLTLQAMADLYCLDIKVLTDVERCPTMRIQSRTKNPARPIWVAYSSKTLHYDIIVPTKRTPSNLADD